LAIKIKIIKDKKLALYNIIESIVLKKVHSNFGMVGHIFFRLSNEEKALRLMVTT
jgi:hypothetical protein